MSQESTKIFFFSFVLAHIQIQAGLILINVNVLMKTVASEAMINVSTDGKVLMTYF